MSIPIISSRASARAVVDLGAEQDSEPGGVLDRVDHVGHAEGLERLERVVDAGERLLEGHTQARHLLHRNCPHQGLLVGEVSIDGRVTDPDRPGGLAKGKSVQPLLLNQLQGCVDKGAPQVAVMVTAGPALGTG